MLDLMVCNTVLMDVIKADIMQLDMTGPHEVFTKMPDTEVLVVWK